MREVLHIYRVLFLAFPAFTRTAIVVVTSRNLAIFLPIIGRRDTVVNKA